MGKARFGLNKALEVLLGIAIISMVVVASVGVFMRWVFNNQPSFTTEFVSYTLLWTSLLSAAYCFGGKKHIAITFIKDKFKGKSALAINIFIELAIIFFAVTILIYGGYKGMLMGMNEIAPTLQLKVGYVYAVFPISGVLTVLYSILNIIDYLRNGQESTVQ